MRVTLFMAASIIPICGNNPLVDPPVDEVAVEIAKAPRYSAKKDARGYMEIIVAKLKEEVENGKGIARITAANTLIKLAELENIKEADQDVPVKFIEIGNDASGKIIQLPERKVV